MAVPLADNSNPDWISLATSITTTVTWPIESSIDMRLGFHARLDIDLNFLAKALMQNEDTFPGVIKLSVIPY